MSFRETYIDNVYTGSLWKHLSQDRSDPGNNTDYLVGIKRDGYIWFGANPRNNSYEYSEEEFLRYLVPIGNEVVKDKVRLSTILTQLRNSPRLPHEIEELIVELDI